MLGIGSMSPASSSSSAWNPRDSDKFPTGLRVLVVDDDPTCLKILEKMLKSCLYNVTKCSRAIEALSTLREHRDGFDVVISDVHMPDMDGFKLLEHIVFEMDLPVIMMSADDSRNVVMNGITHGACDYLIKPVRMEALRNIWQHVVRKQKNGWKDFEQSGSAEEGEKQLKPAEEADSSSANESDWRNSKKRKDEEEDVEDRDDNTTLKKPRVVWSVELHQQFVGAVNQLGVEKAVPKKILELMNVPGLTRENVASHLQKYRLYLRRLSGVTQHPCNTYISQHEATYGPMSSLSGLELQALAATGQLPPQSLASLQATGLGRSAGKSRIPVPFVDQSNIFSFENPKVRFGDGQQHLSSSNQINLLHGIPTAMDSKQLANFHHAAQSLVGMNASVSAQGGQSRPMMVRMSQSQSAGQILSETIGSHVSRLPNSMGQSIICNTLSDGVVVRNGLGENSRGASNPAAQSPSMLNFPSNNSVELRGSGFPFGSPPAVSSYTSKGTFQEEVSSNMKGTGDFIPAYDVFSDVHQQKSNNWESQCIGLNFTPSLQPVSVQSNLDIGHTYAVYSLSSNEQNQNVAGVTWPFNPVENASSSLTPHVAGHLNTSLSDHSVRIKAENTIYPESIDQEDLMSALLKQQQTEIGQSENDFDFEGYHMDNIPV